MPVLHESILRRDVFQENDMKVGPGGDLSTVAGVDSLLLRIDRMLVTNPGEIFHRPDFGIGIIRFLNQNNTADNAARLHNEIKRNLAKDPDIERVVQVKLERRDAQVTVRVVVTAIGGITVGADFGYQNG